MEWKEYRKNLDVAFEKFIFDSRITLALYRARDNQRRIYIIGNGGSAAIAMHYACDLSKRAKCMAVCLAEPTATITAIANDISYEDIYSYQLKNLAEMDDVLIAISSSGNSKNIIKAVEYANSIGMITIGICGFDGGRLKEISDYVAYVNDRKYEYCEDIHAIFGHYLTTWLEENV